MAARIEEVRTFWNEHPCGAVASDLADRRRYFQEIERRRYVGGDPRGASGSCIAEIARFENYKGRDVLEIGCGAGTDGLQFARAGARYVGVDLTPTAIALAKEQFEIEGAAGRFEVANAQALPFPDASFDHIYSFGVIHHSPNTEAIVQEVYRVLRPGGTICVMIYNRSSIYYHVEIMVLRKLVRLLLRPSFMPALLHRLTGYGETALREYRDVVVKRGRMSKAEWISINTDGPFCPLAKVYGKSEALELFKAFAGVRFEVRWPRISHWPLIGSRLPDRVAEWLGRRWGFFRIVYGSKPA